MKSSIISGPQVVKPESYTLGAQQAIAAPTFYFANNHGAGVAMVSQPSQRQENNGQQLPHKTYPTQAVPLPPQFVNPTSFPVYQSPRVYTQQASFSLISHDIIFSLISHGIENNPNTLVLNLIYLC